MRRALAVAIVCASGAARAEPLVAPPPIGRVFVGPTSAHVTSIVYNPAAAGLLQGTHILIAGSARLERNHVERSAIDSATGEPTLGGDRTFAPVTASVATPGAFAGIVSDISTENLTVAGAFTMPFNQRLPDYPDALGYHALGGSLYTPAIYVGASYRVQRTFYAGVGVSVMFPKLDVSFLRDRRLDTCAAAPCDVEDPAARQRWTIETSWEEALTFALEGVGVNLGALYRLGDWWIGASIEFLTPGGARRVGAIRIEDDGGTIASRGRVQYDLPQFFRLGVRRPALAGFELLVNATYTRASAHERIDVRLVEPPPGTPDWLVRHRGFSDTLAIEAGLEQPAASRVRLGARLRLETSTVPERRVTVAQLDGHEAELAAGAELRLSNSVALIAGLSFSFMLPVDADPSAFSPGAAIECVAASFDLAVPGCELARQGRATPTAAGSYGRLGGTFSLGITYDRW